jgi:hypothetical protein
MVCPVDMIRSNDGKDCVCRDRGMVLEHNPTTNMKHCIIPEPIECPVPMRPNKDGTFCECPEGMRLDKSPQGLKCVDVSEEPKCPNTMMKLVGTECVCPKGFKVSDSGKECIDNTNVVEDHCHE